jgi:uncharacterized protein (DUF302 family)
MNDNAVPNESRPPVGVDGYKRRTVWVAAVIGALIGAALCGVIIFTVMPSAMIVTHDSRLGFDETVSALEESIADEGWVVSTVMDMNKSMAKHGVELEPRVKLVKLCHPQYAKSVLTTDREISTFMPCTLAVWEDDEGEVRISSMNMGLMAKMFGGNVATVMGGQVADDEEAILSRVLED